MKFQKWHIAPPHPEAAARLTAAGYPCLVSAVLASRGIATEEEAAAFLEQEQRLTYSPFLMADMDKAAARVQQALADGEKIAVDPSARRLFSYVPQGNTMFSGTIAENMRNVRPEASDEEICEVLKAACAWEFVEKLPDGIYSMVGERGGGFSEGQAQRLSIARALLRTDSAVYIYDEAASNIDVESEELIMNVIHDLAKPKTVLLISHRLANVVKSDKIYFLKDGEIKESGKHEELMSQNGAYRHLYESQMALENYGKGGVA